MYSWLLMVRTLILSGLLCASTMDTCAQQRNSYEFRAEQNLVRAQHKAVYTVIAPLDESALCTFDGARFKVNVSAGVSGTTVLDALNLAGIGPVEWTQEPVIYLSKDTFNDFPMLIDTGDPAHDEAVHGAAKEAWFAANPGALELYRRQLEGNGEQER
jgi:hypothetical protein